MILKECYRDELVEFIKDTNESVFTSVGKTIETILADEQLMDRLWACYQKNVEEYGCDEKFSYQDAMKNVFGVEIAEECSELTYVNAEWLDPKKIHPAYPDEQKLLPFSCTWQEYMCLVKKDGKICRIAMEFSPDGKWLREGTDYTENIIGWEPIPDIPEDILKNEYYKFSDGYFTYFVNTETGKKKLKLDPGDVEVETKPDDFQHN